jgi:hypothetical protein
VPTYCTGKFDKADELYQKVLEQDPTDPIVMKRQICIRKALGDTGYTSVCACDVSHCSSATAIKMLNDYLNVFMTDVDAWLELADLYIEQQM